MLPTARTWTPHTQQNKSHKTFHIIMIKKTRVEVIIFGEKKLRKQLERVIEEYTASVESHEILRRIKNTKELFRSCTEHTNK